MADAWVLRVSPFCVFRPSKVNGIPSCASSELLRSKLREEWGFRTWAHWLVNAIATPCGILLAAVFRDDEVA